jgi:hypothetical protein
MRLTQAGANDFGESWIDRRLPSLIPNQDPQGKDGKKTEPNCLPIVSL